MRPSSAFINHACDIIGDTKTGISGSKIVEQLNSYAVKYNVDIPYSTYPFPKLVPNKRTALRENLQKFTIEQQVYILNTLCQLPQLAGNKAVNDLRYQIISSYGHLIEQSDKSIDTAIIEQTRHWLSDFPESLQLYEAALIKLENKIFLRNLLDDLRLSLEKLVQSLLKKDKSLEKQMSDLGLFLEESGCSKEFRNMFHKLFEYYTKYQNTYIKHDNAVIESELEIVFEMTCSFMRFLIRIKNKG